MTTATPTTYRGCIVSSFWMRLVDGHTLNDAAWQREATTYQRWIRAEHAAGRVGHVMPWERDDV